VNPNRLDAVMVSEGLARSRAVAVELIKSGKVTVDGHVSTKPSTPVSAGVSIVVEGADHYVSRGAHKLIGALSEFEICIAGRTALDLGASTGGFTQVLLEHGARRVIALDVGHGQLSSAIAEDPRVTTVEGFNVRDLTRSKLNAVAGQTEGLDLVVGDLSFISLRYVFEPLRATLVDDADVILLVKPQFEVGRTGVREGIVRDPLLRVDALETVLWSAWDSGFGICGLALSPIVGTHGNEEYLVHMRTRGGAHPTEWMQRAHDLAGGG